MSYSGHHRSQDDACSPEARGGGVRASRDPRAAASGQATTPAHTPDRHHAACLPGPGQTPTMMELNLSVWRHGDRATIQVGGEIDLATGPQLQAVLVELVDRGFYQLIVDLAQVTFLDCAGIRVLVDALRRVHQDGGSLRLVRPTRRVERVLALTGMTTVFPIDASPGKVLATEAIGP
jgi:anti-sigma B factor antagonist